LIDDKIVEGELKVQDALISYFAYIGKTTASSVSSSSSLNDFRSYLGLIYLKSIALEPLYEFEIARIVNGLEGSASSGPYCISSKVVKFILRVIVSALTRLVNMTFENGVFQSALKPSCFTILFEDGSQNNSASFFLIYSSLKFSKIIQFK